jgi:hypothetical protein
LGHRTSGKESLPSPVPAFLLFNKRLALPSGVKLTTLDNGLVIIVRRSPLLQSGVMVELQP